MPANAKTDAHGAATIDNLPADAYKVIAWHFRQSDPNAQPTQKVNADGAVKFALQLRPAE